jgi:RHS repeat-associated protein
MAYTYDAAGRLETVTDPATKVYRYTYDRNGNRASLEHPNGAITSYTYDSLNRLSRLTTQRWTEGIQDYAFTLGATGNRTQIQEADGIIRSFAYDALYRLTRETVSAGGAQVYERTFTYAAVGNRLTQTTSGQGASSVTYSYDDRDRLLAENATAYSYDAAGNLTAKSGEATYAWDSENRLSRVELSAGTVVEQTYDVDGNRVRTKVTPPAAPPSITDYLVDTSGALSHVVVESDGVTGEPHTYYVRGGDELLAVLRPGSARFVHADGLGSIRKLSDESGVVTDAYEYTAFGEPVAHLGSDPQPYQFAGEAYDANIGFSYNRARWLDPKVGRFLSADTAETSIFEPRTLHLYSYAHGDPVNFTDPSGNFEISSLLVAGVIAGIVNSILVAVLNPAATVGDIVMAFLTGFVEGVLFEAGTSVLLSTAAKTYARFARIPRIAGWDSAIAPYGTLKEFTRYQNHTVEAHHLIDRRLLKDLGYSRRQIADSPSIVLTKAEHDAVTNLFRRELPRQAGTYNKRQVLAACEEIYSGNPRVLNAVRLFLLP